jgi:hypothetical protein
MSNLPAHPRTRGNSAVPGGVPNRRLRGFPWSRHTALWLALLLVVNLAVASLAEPPTSGKSAANSPQVTAEQELSPDLALYSAVIEAVRRGEPYHVAAARELPKNGFESFSPFNWRLPTYAWVAGAFPNTEMVRWILVALALVSGGSVVRQAARADGPVAAIVTGWGLVGVLGWLFDGAAHLTQEVWCAVGLTGALALRRAGRPLSASGVELACLFVRELVLPWIGVGLIVAAWRRRWTELGLLTAGLAAWCAFFAWHLARIREFSPPDQTITSGIGAWLAYGGIPFVLQTVRMNALLSSVPGWVAGLFDAACLAGLVLGLRGGPRPSNLVDPNREREFFVRLLVIAAGYQLAFLVVGRPWHLYWGFLYAPILPLGAGRLAATLAARLHPDGSPVVRSTPEP